MIAATTWGNPAATPGKRVLLLHGLTKSSQWYHRVAQAFVSRGCHVTAPDLLGHGLARRGSVYTIAAIAQEILPLLTSVGPAPAYDIVVGHSLGGVVAAALLPHLGGTESGTGSSRVRVVLVDPPFEVPSECLSTDKQSIVKAIRDVQQAPPAKVFVEESPLWMKEEAVFAFAGAQLCNTVTIEAIFEQNDPWSFSHLLSTTPNNVKVVVLAADPSKPGTRVREETLKAYEHVTVKTVWGSTHSMPIEVPDVIVDAALGEVH